MMDNDELQLMIDQIAQKIAAVEPDPNLWLAWLVYLLQRLESHASTSSPQARSYDEMLDGLEDAISDRRVTQHW